MQQRSKVKELLSSLWAEARQNSCGNQLRMQMTNSHANLKVCIQVQACVTQIMCFGFSSSADHPLDGKRVVDSPRLTELNYQHSTYTNYEITVTNLTK